MLNKFRLQAFNMVNSGWFTLFIVCLILVNIPLSIFSSGTDLKPIELAGIQKTDTFITIVFTIEYLLRIWTAPLFPEYRGSRLKFALRPTMIIDLLAIIPVSYLQIPLLRTFRMMRIFRILKLAQYSSSVKTILRVVNNKMDVLLSISFIIGFLILLSSFLVYYAEHPVQPKNFDTIYDAIWYCFMIVSTVGSSLEVQTNMGKIVTAVTSLFGIMLVAVYAGIFSAGFSEVSAAERAAAAKAAAQNADAQNGADENAAAEKLTAEKTVIKNARPQNDGNGQ